MNLANEDKMSPGIQTTSKQWSGREASVNEGFANLANEATGRRAIGESGEPGQRPATQCASIAVFLLLGRKDHLARTNVTNMGEHFLSIRCVADFSVILCRVSQRVRPSLEDSLWAAVGAGNERGGEVM